jgi:hypothetical protein
VTIRFTEADSARQEAVIAILAKAWACDIWHFSDTTSNIDYVAARDAPGRTRQQVAAFIEVKCNSGTIADLERHGQVWVDANKIEAFCSMYRYLRVPSMYVVAREDGIVFLRVETTDPPWEAREVGRTDRGDPADVRRAYRVPFNLFKVLKHAGPVHANRQSA